MELFCNLCISLPYCHVCFLQPDPLTLLYVMFSCLLSLSILCPVSGVVLDLWFPDHLFRFSYL